MAKKGITWVAPLRDGVPTPADGGRCRPTVTPLRSLTLALLALGCGDGRSIERTAGTLETVRGSIAIAEAQVAQVARVAAGERIELGEHAMARLALDHGPRVILGASSAATLTDEETLELSAGKVYVEIGAEPLALVTARGTLRMRDAGVSIAIEGGAVRAHVLRGELAYVAGEARGIVGSGHRLVLGEEVAIEPVALSHDWTGGLAEAGPREALALVGVGMLEARVPDEVGLARWPLVVRRLDVRVRVEGDLAITEIDQVFFNPASETLEGFYRVRVPESAILSRFAVDRDGRLVDGYVREREMARRAYDEQVYRGSTLDPALLEWDGPGAYRARIYPIAPGQTRRIVVRWAEQLRASDPGAPRMYRYPMGGSERAPRISELSIEVTVGEDVERMRAGLGATVEEGAVRLRRSDFVPRADFWLELFGGASGTRAWRAPHQPPPRAPGSRIVTNEADERDYWVAPLVLPARLAERAGALDVVVVADLSAATDRAHLELGRSAVESIAGLLGPDDRLAVLGADVGARALGDDALGAVDPARVEALLSALARAPAEGATDLGGALTRGAALLDPSRAAVSSVAPLRDGTPPPSGAARLRAVGMPSLRSAPILVYVGDGRATVGERTGAALRERLERLPHPVRLYAIAIGAGADLELLASVSRGAGLARRVEERRDAADAALDLLAHAARPVAQGVTVELGDGIESAYPRRPVDVVIGDVLPIVGRVRGEPPSAVVVRGTVSGVPFEESLELTTEDSADATDPRLRWAAARLAQLLDEGASREEVAELGVRAGIITPYTSFYVPSAAELGRMGASALPLIDRNGVLAERRTETPAILALALGPLGILGCAESSPEARPVELALPSAPSPETPADAVMDIATSPASTTPRLDAPSPVDPSPVAPSSPAPVVAMPPTSAVEPEPTAEEYELAEVPAEPPRARPARMAHREGSGGAVGGLDAPTVSAQVRAAALGCGSGRAGTVVVRITIAPSGAVTSASIASSSLGDPSVEGCIVQRVRGLRFASGAGLTVTVSLSFAGAPSPPRALIFAQLGPYAVLAAQEELRADGHRVRRCSDASALPLAERRELWRERLGAGQRWSEVLREAARACELPSWRDRSALLSAILDHAGTVVAMLEIARNLGASADREHARRTILSRVRSPEDIRALRAAFGDEVAYAQIEQVIERARTPDERIRALRRLSEQYPGSFDLSLRLLEELEAAGRDEECLRLARRLRHDPLADPGVRTAIGELLLRHDRVDDARRAFSEIVEHAPMDELARRRLGDLYLAHAWYDDAYRQYETLRELRPDEPSVLLLLARASAGAGRIDEALRLEQRVRETAEPGASTGLARIAQLWSSARYARLRHLLQNGAAGDGERLGELERLRRRSGVLRGASPLRVTLTFAHPDAGLTLWAAHPERPLARPRDLYPEHGLEAFDVEELERGAYRIEVRREDDDPGAIDAELCIVWSEGRPEERIEIVPLRFEGSRRDLAWILEDGALRPTDE